MTKLPTNLRYSTDSEDGFSTKVITGHRIFYDASGSVISNPSILERLNSLAIAPSFKNVWICADASGHLQMTAIDTNNRKQYRYHDDWSDFRSKKKFSTLEHFGESLPKIRRRVYRHLRGDVCNKNYSTAALLRLIDTSALRVGSSVYTDSNGSFGASTLRDKHLTLGEDFIKLDFSAKGGKRVRKIIRDKTLNRVLDAIDDLPGRNIFQYVDDNGQIQSITSHDVNSYLPNEFSAKTFRTWHGTVAAYRAAEKVSGDLTLKTLSESAAERLHNTAAICRSSYIHPAVVALASLDPQERQNFLKPIQATQRIARLKRTEARCLALIKSWHEALKVY